MCSMTMAALSSRRSPQRVLSDLHVPKTFCREHTSLVLFVYIYIYIFTYIYVFCEHIYMYISHAHAHAASESCIGGRGWWSSLQNSRMKACGTCWPYCEWFISVNICVPLKIMWTSSPPFGKNSQSIKFVWHHSKLRHRFEFVWNPFASSTHTCCHLRLFETVRIVFGIVWDNLNACGLK